MSRPKEINRDATMQPIRGASLLTGLSQSYIRAGCKAGTIPHIRVGSDYRINMKLFLDQLNRETINA